MPGRGRVEKNERLALGLLRSAAELGELSAQAIYGLPLVQGKQVPQDLALGIRYALASAPAGDINGQVLLARSFYFGRGVPKDLVESARWFRKAAQQVCRPGAEDLQQPDLAEAARSIKD